MQHSLVAVTIALALAAPRAVADVAIYADGRRAQVEQPAKDSGGQWMGTLDGRRQRLVPGEIVALVDEQGEERSLVPALVDATLTAAQESALASLNDAKDESWFLAAEQLSNPPTRAVLDALVELSANGKKDVRARAVTAMARMRTTESSLAAARAVLAEKDAKARRAGAAALFSVREILRRADASELVLAGLADKDALVRVEFALIAPHDLEQAGSVLRKDGLKHSDHHVRESAAVELGRRGDAAGEKILIAMLAREALPGMEDDPGAGERFLIREQVELCEILGRLGGEAARAALTKAKSNSPHEAVRKSAEAALAAAPARKDVQARNALPLYSRSA